MVQRSIAMIVALLVVVSGCFSAVLTAAPTREQRTEVNLIRKDLLKAGNLDSQGKFKESGRLIGELQGRVEKLAATKD
ncbi:MAG: hypothetical protein VB857_09465, partial [Pirellulaceae bacterium]